MYATRLLLREVMTHDVQRYILEKPANYRFTPGQAINLAIDSPEWRDQPRPFTLTNRVDDQVLELMIKSYGSHDGVTEHLATSKPGTKLTISEPFDSFSYQGPGWFIAAGAGITPFLAIIRDLAERDAIGELNLIYSNKSPADVLQQRELQYYFGDRVHFVCTREQSDLCAHFGHVDDTYLANTIANFDQSFYVCGPAGFTKTVQESLQARGANAQSMKFG